MLIKSQEKEDISLLIRSHGGDATGGEKNGKGARLSRRRSGGEGHRHEDGRKKQLGLDKGIKVFNQEIIDGGKGTALLLVEQKKQRGKRGEGESNRRTREGGNA